MALTHETTQLQNPKQHQHQFALKCGKINFIKFISNNNMHTSYYNQYIQDTISSSTATTGTTLLDLQIDKLLN
jgi:hypothetical protein